METYYRINDTHSNTTPYLQKVTVLSRTTKGFYIPTIMGNRVLKLWRTPFGQSIKPSPEQAWGHYLEVKFAPVAAARRRLQEAEARYQEALYEAGEGNGASWLQAMDASIRARETEL